MSYTPNTWATGDTVTSAKLNNMETGIANAANAFVVTLTPTSPDYSGTMDKTVAEINTAYEAGKRIVFRVMESQTTYSDVSVTMTYTGNETYPSFNAFIIMTELNALVFAATNATNDGTRNTYSTYLYTLTPMS